MIVSFVKLNYIRFLLARVSLNQLLVLEVEPERIKVTLGILRIIVEE